MTQLFFPQTLYPKTKDTLNLLQNDGFLVKSDFYLAGGTALALQLGHRLSIDLDWMSPTFTQPSLLLSQLKKFKPTVIQENKGTLDVLINQTKVSFLNYNYPLVQDLVSYEKIKLADILDIAAMKLTAISSRGSRKDYVDLYFILQKVSLPEILQVFTQKYQGVNYSLMHLAKSLVYFQPAENEPEVDYIESEKIDWMQIKNKMEQEVQTILSWQQ